MQQISIAKISREECESLRTQFILQGLTQSTKIGYDVLCVHIPESQPLNLIDDLTLCDTDLWYGISNNDTLLFNDFIFIDGMPEEDISDLIMSYPIENVGFAYKEEFTHNEYNVTFLTSNLWAYAHMYTTYIIEGM